MKFFRVGLTFIGKANGATLGVDGAMPEEAREDGSSDSSSAGDVQPGCRRRKERGVGWSGSTDTSDDRGQEGRVGDDWPSRVSCCKSSRYPAGPAVSRKTLTLVEVLRCRVKCITCTNLGSAHPMYDIDCHYLRFPHGWV